MLVPNVATNVISSMHALIKIIVNVRPERSTLILTFIIRMPMNDTLARV